MAKSVNVQIPISSKIVLNDFNLENYDGKSIVMIDGSGHENSIILEFPLDTFKSKNSSKSIDGYETIGVSKDEQSRFYDKIRMQFQRVGLFNTQSVWENLAFGLIAQKHSRGEARNITVSKLAQVGLGLEFTNRYPITNEISDALVIHSAEDTDEKALTILHVQSERKIANRIAMDFQDTITWKRSTDQFDDCSGEHADQFIPGKTDGLVQMAWLN